MISFIILITPTLPIGCKDEGGQPTPPLGDPQTQSTTESATIGDGGEPGGGEPDQEIDEDEYFRRMADKLPRHEKTPPPLDDTSVLQGSGPEVLSTFPPEADQDQDGFVDAEIPSLPHLRVDNCPAVANPDQTDADGNGIGDACD